MEAKRSAIVLYVIIIAGILLATGKFIASYYTGSVTLLAEGFHSMAGLGMGLLLWLGLKRAKKTPTALHPFGYGREIYFRVYVAGILIFSLAGGLAIYAGIHSLFTPEILYYPWWIYTVIFLALIIESITLFTALQAFNRSRDRSKNNLSNIIKSKDAATFIFILRETVAIMSLLVTLLGIFLSQQLQSPYMDSAASILIGALLIITAIFLTRECKSLLLGEEPAPHVITSVEKILHRNINIRDWSLPQTTLIGPGEFLLILELDLLENLNEDQAERTMESLRLEIKHKQPEMSRVIIQTTTKTENTPKDDL